MRVMFRIMGYTEGKALNLQHVEIWGFLATLISLLVFVGGINYIVIRRIRTLSDATREVAKGDFDTQLDEEDSDEIGLLIRDFNLMAKELKSNEYLSRDFVKNFSHELKTPVSSIKGYAELIEASSDAQSDIQEYAKIIRQESERLSSLSQNLLKISQLDSNIIIKQDDVFLLDEQIRQVILVSQSLWEAKGLEFELELSPLKIRSNKELLFIVWQNLISNAIKFSLEGGKINISLKLIGNTIRFEIADNGIGFSKEDGENLFKEFFIANKPRNKSGSGLGLTIAKKIIDKLKGTVSFSSTPNEGAAFIVELTNTDATQIDDPSENANN